MNNYIRAELTELQQKLNGYLMLFNYRITNYCVKAEPTAMLPVTVVLGDSDYNFEEVADATKPDDYTFQVIPKNQNNLQAIIDGVFDVHPEFKMEIKTIQTDGGNEERRVLYTMPEVTKERRDLLNEATKVFHGECKVKLDAAYAKHLANITALFPHMEGSETEEAKNAFKKVYNDVKDQADKLQEAKLKEIEEGYQRYLSEQAVESVEIDSSNAGQSFRLSPMEGYSN